MMRFTCIGLIMSIAVCSFGFGFHINDKRVEICVWEMHLLNCTEEGQISILSAKYGLMLEGRCNNNKSENTNCSDENDVRSFVKTKCEQRIDWEIELPDKKLDNMTLSTCPKSAIKTLEIAYWCKSNVTTETSPFPISVVIPIVLVMIAVTFIGAIVLKKHRLTRSHLKNQRATIVENTTRSKSYENSNIPAQRRASEENTVTSRSYETIGMPAQSAARGENTVSSRSYENSNIPAQRAATVETTVRSRAYENSNIPAKLPAIEEHAGPSRSYETIGMPGQKPRVEPIPPISSEYSDVYDAIDVEHSATTNAVLATHRYNTPSLQQDKPSLDSQSTVHPGDIVRWFFVTLCIL